MNSTRHLRDHEPDVCPEGKEDHPSNNQHHQHLRAIVHRLCPFQDHVLALYIYISIVVTVLGSKVLELGPFRTTYC